MIVTVAHKQQNVPTLQTMAASSSALENCENSCGHPHHFICVVLHRRYFYVFETQF
jgi:hypothetical protein